VTQKGKDHDTIVFDAHYLENGYTLGDNEAPIKMCAWDDIT